MNRLAQTLTGVLSAAILAAHAMAASPEEMIKGAKDLDAAFLKAFNEHNVEAVIPLYWNSPETVSMPPDAMVAKGHQAIKESFAQMVVTMQGCTLELTESHYMPIGDVVATWGLWRMTMPGPDGKPLELLGRYTDLKAQKDGQWVYVMDHASMPAPPPPAPEPAPKH